MEVSCKNDLATFGAIFGKLCNFLFHFIIWSHCPGPESSLFNFAHKYSPSEFLQLTINIYSCRSYRQVDGNSNGSVSMRAKVVNSLWGLRSNNDSAIFYNFLFSRKRLQMSGLILSCQWIGCCCCCRPHISIFGINDAAEIGGSNPWLNLGPHCKNIGSIVSWEK